MRTKPTHASIIADFLVERIDPKFIATIASENPATEDDLNQVVRYAFELLARRLDQHIFYYFCGDDQPLRKSHGGKVKTYFHDHICFRLDKGNDVAPWFIRRLLDDCFAKASKRSKRKFYKNNREKANNATVWSKNPSACAKLQYDLRINTHVDVYGAQEKTGFSHYLAKHESELHLEIACPRKEKKCNRVHHQYDDAGNIIRGRSERRCGLSSHVLSTRLNKTK